MVNELRSQLYASSSDFQLVANGKQSNLSAKKLHIYFVHDNYSLQATFLTVTLILSVLGLSLEQCM